MVVLALLTLPTFNGTYVTQANAMAHNLKLAVDTYQKDYGRFPAISATTGDTVIDTPDEWRLLSAVLNGGQDVDTLAVNPEAQKLNPRQIVYLSFTRADITHGHVTYPYFVSPMKSQLLYTIKMDTDQNGVLGNLPSKAGGVITAKEKSAVWLEDPSSPHSIHTNTYE
ncbi:MAG: hypothetical protein AAGK14_00985 [Verrucomicrobiota bacterium]